MDHMNILGDISQTSPLRKRLTKRVWSLAVSGLVVVSLSGCGSWTDIKRAMGIEKTPISDTEIVQLPPLVVPPDYQIRPPSDGSPSDPYPAAISPPEPGIPEAETPPVDAADAVDAVAEPVPPPPVDALVAVVPPAVSAPVPSAPLGYSPLYFAQTDPTLAVFNRAFRDYAVANFPSTSQPVYMSGMVR